MKRISSGTVIVNFTTYLLKRVYWLSLIIKKILGIQR